MSIKMYQVTSNTVTRKIRIFLEQYDLDFKTIKICPETFSKGDFFEILSMTEEGVYELLSDRSTIYKRMKDANFDFDALSLSELYELIIKNPTLLKTPIVVNKEDNRLVIGNDSELLIKIVPKELRNSSK